MISSARLSIARSFLRKNKVCFPVSRNFSSNDDIPYTEQQKKLNRPLSPHVTIYKFPITAITSITNRVTGISLTLGVSGIGIMSLFGGDPASCFSMLGGMFFIGPVAKLVVGFPLVYHFLGGLRHFYWDSAPETLTNSDVEASSYVLIGSSVFLSIVAAII